MGTGYHVYCKNCFSLENSEEDEGFTSTDYSKYQIRTGGGFLCFHKEQLEEDFENILDGEKETIEVIKVKLKEGFSFNELVGYLPYYCEKCKILDNRYYFEMSKDNEKYIPIYKCSLCSEELKSAIISSELKDGGSWAGDIIKYKVGDLRIDIKNKRLKIYDSNNKEYKLLCRKCNGGDFYIDQNIMWD